METYSFLNFEFTEDLVQGDVVSFVYGDSNNSIKVSETFEEVRFGPGIVPILPPTEIPGESSAMAFVDAFNSDFNITDIFEVVRTENIVEIRAREYGIDFSIIEGPVSVLRNTGSGTPPFSILSIEFSSGSDCAHITATITTSALADEMISPIQQMPVSNPIILDLDRSSSYEVHLRKGTDHIYQVFGTPQEMFSSGISLVINDNPAGSSVRINAYGIGLNFKYSLNGIDYFNSNYFTSLIGGQYTAYIKDQFGCVTTKNFELDGFGINSPFFYLPESNSIRFADRVVWGDCSNYKNDDNTLSCEVDVPLPKKEIQQFQTCDVITTQFKSNYINNAAAIRIIGESGASIIPVVKLTDYMKRKDKRDAKVYDLGDGKIGIYFISGNTYDYETTAINGNYTLNGALPEWGKAGNFLQMPSSEWYLIEDIVYLDELNAELLVISAPFVNIGTVVSSYYNLQNYEVYEFTINFLTYKDKRVQISIVASDPYFDEVKKLSEEIDVKIRQENTIEIRYSNNENTDVYYASGIVNKMRLPIERVDGAPLDETTTYNTDTGTILLSTDVRKSDIFTFSPVTKAMMWKLIIALSHKNVQLDGVYYVKQSIEVEGSLEDTNLYDVKATMIRSNAAFRSDGLQFDESGMEIPALIPVDNTSGGYVKYQ